MVKRLSASSSAAPTHIGAYRIRPSSVRRVDVIRVLYGRYFGGDIVSVGYAIAHPRLNPVGILPPGSRPSDVHFHDGIIAVNVKALSRLAAMTCEACEAETQARLIARGKRSVTPGCHHPPPTQRPQRTRITYHPRQPTVNTPLHIFRPLMHTRYPAILTAERLQLQ